MDRSDLLLRVMRPARYLGGEAGSVIKDPARVRLSLALAFPEVYEIAMSHLGIKILYESLAPRPEIAAERVFMPWVDLMDLMEGEGLAPWSLESGRPLDEFDVVGFSLQYELTYTNVLKMLRLAGIPLRRGQRGPQHPIVIAGGPCLVNPEPMADFLDLGLIGEAEEVLHPLVDVLLAAKEAAWPKERLYKEASRLPGVYAPSLYEPIYDGGVLKEIRPKDPERPKVRRAVAADLNAQPIPVRQVSPWVKPVHDRLGLEVARGCTRGCRFCQAGYIYRPVRERQGQAVLDAALDGLARTGMEELALLSLSTGDYSCVEGLAGALMDALAPRRVSLSLPSLRVDSLSGELAEHIKRVRKTGFTLAPEAGSARMRALINKNISEEQILATAGMVYGLGWNLIKLYFMIGLPGESDADLTAIGGLCDKVAALSKRGGGKRPVVNASIGLFVPKPHTPFQWAAQMDRAEAGRRLELVKGSLGGRKVKAKWSSPRQSVLEGLLARGDRRLGRVLELAVEMGCRFDGWSEELNFGAWLDALDQAGLRLEDYLRARDPDEVLPWDHIDPGVSKDYLRQELEAALAGESTGDCRGGQCLNCGVCDFKAIKPRLAQGELQKSPAQPEPEGEPKVYRFRLEKAGPARLLGHLEMMTQIERAFRRAGVKVAHSRGFHPHPQIKTQSALPLGVESLVEELEVKVWEEPDTARLAEKVNAVMPSGLRLGGGRLRKPGEGLREPDEVTYEIRPAGPLDMERIQWFKGLDSMPYLRQTPKGTKELDLAATVLALEAAPHGLTVTVGRRGGRPKPHEVLEGIFGISRDQALAARALKTGLAWHPKEEANGGDSTD